MIYTVFCKQTNDTGTTWIDTVEVDPSRFGGIPHGERMHFVQNLATQKCAEEWGLDNDDEISCYCVIAGNVEVLAFEDLSE